MIRADDAWLSRAFEASAEEFMDLIEASASILKREQVLREGSGVVKIAPRGCVSVVGDLHGDAESLIHILCDSGVVSSDRVIFLGDYGDRGTGSAEVYYLILKLKLTYGDRVVMLRGNHECTTMPVMPHDLPMLFERRFGHDGGVEVYNGIRALWRWLPHCALVEGKYLMLHGGIPAGVKSVREFEYPSEAILEQILWSDPVEGRGYYSSMRGAGMMFGEDVTEHALRITGVRTVIRSHEPCEGVRVTQNGKILTVFSRKGAPYYNTRAAYLAIDVSREAMDAVELVRTAARIW